MSSKLSLVSRNEPPLSFLYRVSGLVLMAGSVNSRQVCHGAHFGEGPVLAILAMLARQGALRVVPGGCAPRISSVARRGSGVARSGRGSSRAGRTGKLA